MICVTAAKLSREHLLIDASRTVHLVSAYQITTTQQARASAIAKKDGEVEQR